MSDPSKFLDKSSRLSGFYKLNRGERMDILRAFANLPVDQTRVLGSDGALNFELADLFVENAIGSFPLPLGIGTSFKVNSKDYVVPFAVEESSVVAAASNAAKCIYENGGFQAEQLNNLMIGQIQILDIAIENFAATERKILNAKEELLKLANEIHPRLLMRGGGSRSIEVRSFPNASIPFMVVHIHLDTRDAMGANLVNTVCEALAPSIEVISGGRVGLKILSNLADLNVYRSRAIINPEQLIPKGSCLKGEVIAQRIVEAFVFADEDPYRAATHNKGIMNGVDPVCIATGNDWRAIEAGVHAYAARTGRYRSLSKWSINSKGQLEAELELPLQLGTVGGVTRLHPLARLSLEILGSPDSKTLGCIIASTGLASNLAALRALCTTGIQRGHMKLHAKNLALAAGSRGREVEIVAKLLVERKDVSASAAESVLAEIRSEAIKPTIEITRELEVH